MKKAILVLLIVVLFVPTIATVALAFEWPVECTYARYNPSAFLVPCLVAICFELGGDLEDYL